MKLSYLTVIIQSFFKRGIYMKTTQKLFLFSIASALFLLGGCGSTDSSTTSTAYSGQVIDSYVSDMEYSCADGKESITGSLGEFSCEQLPVRFKIGGVVFGEVATLPVDRQVFPQDMIGVARSDVRDARIVAMATFLQSSDEDQNSSNGIRIRAQVREALQNRNEFFDAEKLLEYATDANVTLLDENSSVEHLSESVAFVEAVDAVALPPYVKEALFSPKSQLNQELKDTLAYMGNEERLAYDLYNALYDYTINNYSVTLTQLDNIATRSEYKHIQAVQLLVKKYITSPDEFTVVDLPELGYKDTPVEEMQPGVYDVSAIQNLYDSLLAQGESSARSALEVGCIVEVTDVDDLDRDIALAQENNATDVATVFEFLRNGSYNHYWAFDRGLKSMGVEEGCCALGAQYCHPEYPQNTRGANR